MLISYSIPTEKIFVSVCSFLSGIAIGGAGIVGILLGLGLFFLLRRKRVKKSSFSTTMKDLPPTPSSRSLLISASSFSKSTPSGPSSNSIVENGSAYFGVRVFSYQELEDATHNFDPSRELGGGGFGTVYYGKAALHSMLFEVKNASFHPHPIF